MSCRFVTCSHSDYARFCDPTSKLPRILNPLDIWIHVYTCLSRCKYAYISYYSVPLWGHSLIMGWGQKSGRESNIFGSHLMDQQFLTSLGGGNLFYKSCWDTCWSWYISLNEFICQLGDQPFLDSFWMIRNIWAQVCTKHGLGKN